MNENNTPLDFFKLFFDNKVMNYIVDCTNDYAKSKISKDESVKTSMADRWRIIDTDELMKFISVIILMNSYCSCL